MAKLDEETTVYTSKELNSAMAAKYGVIRIQGDLKSEIKASFDKAQGKFGVSAFILFALCVIPVVGQIMLTVGAILGIGSIINVFKNMKSMKYQLREDYAKDDEYCVVHEKLVKKTREKYKSGEEFTAKNYTEIEDMIEMKVNTIHMSEALCDELFKAANLTKSKKTKMSSIDEFKEYRKYIVVRDTPDCRLVRKR